MAMNNRNHLQLPELDDIEPMNDQHNEAIQLGQKLLLHHGRDPALRNGPSSYGNTAVRLNDVPSSGRPAQCPSYRFGNTGAFHASFVHFPGSSSSQLSEPPVSYPHRSEETIAPVSSRLENRRTAMKRKNHIVHHVNGISMDGYHVGSSSNTQVSNYEQPNPTTPTEPLTQMPLSIGQSGWDSQQLFQQEGFQRNVRARHSHNISLEPRTISTHTSNGIYLPSHQSTTSTSPGTLVARNQTPISVPARTVPSGAPETTSRAFIERLHHHVMGSSNSVAAVPSVNGLSGNATFANAGYAPRTVNSVYSHPASSGASGSRAVPHEMVNRSWPPGSSAASSTPLRIGQSCPPGFSAASSTPLRIGQSCPPGFSAASSTSLRIAVGHANSGTHRRGRSSYYAFHPSMDVERLMRQHLVFYESRVAGDPHRDMRLDVDNMSYEDLLALGESIGNVNTGLAEDKISGCVREVVCCSSDPSQNDEDDDGACVVCLEDYKHKDVLGTLKCSHDFHAECIKKWLHVKNSCPICKAAAA